MNRWKGRVALVVGASSGIGAGICRELVKHDMTVVGCARRVHMIRDIAEEDAVKAAPGRLVPMQCDVTKESDILAVFDEIRKTYGRIDVCVNSAGTYVNSSLLNAATEDWRRIFEVNVLAMCICNREAVKLMMEKGIGDGQIINISSTGAYEVLHYSFPGVAYDCGCKFMVRALTEGLRRELTAQKSHIRVASISPGVVEDTEGGDAAFREELKEFVAKVGNIKGLISQDIANAVVHILSSPPHVDINDIIVRAVEES